MGEVTSELLGFGFPLTLPAARSARRNLRSRPALKWSEGRPLALPRSRGERGFRRRQEEDASQNAVDQFRCALAAARPRVRDGLGDGGIGRDPIQVTELVEGHLEDLPQVGSEALERHAADPGDLVVERVLPAQHAKDELAQKAAIGLGQPLGANRHERPGPGAALEDLPKDRNGLRARAARAAAPSAHSKRTGSGAMPRRNSSPVTGFLPARWRRLSRSALPSPAAASTAPAFSNSVPGAR